MAPRKKKTPASNVPEPVPIVDEDDSLMDDLMAQLDSRQETQEPESSGLELVADQNKPEDSQKKTSKLRFQARKAKKAAQALASYVSSDPLADRKLAEEARDEAAQIKRICDELNVYIHEINPDGHCLFSAIADQLSLLSILPSDQANYKTVRVAASSYIHAHPDDFIPFLPSGASDDALDGLMSRQQFDEYCVSIRETAVWGGEPEILALSRAYNVPIHVVQGFKPPIVVHGPNTADTGALASQGIVRISYHRRMYGLGEHYNSLRPAVAASSVL